MRLLDRLFHGPVLYTIHQAGGVSYRMHRDGTSIRFTPKPPAPRHPCIRCGWEWNVKRGQLCWRCKGDDRKTPQHYAYLYHVKALRLEAAAHCDENVLHAPGMCWACDLPEFAPLHGFRRRYSVAYTGATPAPGEVCCPSELYRTTKLINRWPDNRATVDR